MILMIYPLISKIFMYYKKKKKKRSKVLLNFFCITKLQRITIFSKYVPFLQSFIGAHMYSII